HAVSCAPSPMMSSTVSRSSGPKLSYAIVMPFALTWPLRTGILAESEGGFALGSEEAAGSEPLSALREQPRSAPAARRVASRKTLCSTVFMFPPQSYGRAVLLTIGAIAPHVCSSTECRDLIRAVGH